MLRDLVAVVVQLLGLGGGSHGGGLVERLVGGIMTPAAPVVAMMRPAQKTQPFAW